MNQSLLLLIFVLILFVSIVSCLKDSTALEAKEGTLLLSIHFFHITNYYYNI